MVVAVLDLESSNELIRLILLILNEESTFFN